MTDESEYYEAEFEAEDAAAATHGHQQQQQAQQQQWDAHHHQQQQQQQQQWDPQQLEAYYVAQGAYGSDAQPQQTPASARYARAMDEAYALEQQQQAAEAAAQAQAQPSDSLAAQQYESGNAQAAYSSAAASVPPSLRGSVSAPPPSTSSHPHPNPHPQPHPSLSSSHAAAGFGLDPAHAQLRPPVPPYLQSSVPPSQPLPPGVNPQALPLDPRATPDYQVAWELELWRRTEVKAQQERWKAEEAARLRILEEEFAKGVKAEEAKIQMRILKLQQAEKAQAAGQAELEKQRAALRLQQSELASRVASLDRELAKVKGDADAHVSRVKDQSAYEVNKARSQLRDALAQVDLLKKDLRATQAKLSELREESEKERLKHAKSNMGALEAALRRKEDELALITDRWRDACAERDHEKTRLAAALQKGMELYKQIESLKADAIAVKSRDAEQLRAQLLAKEAQVGAKRSVAEAHDLMKEVKAHLLSMRGPERTSVLEMPAHQPAPWTRREMEGLASSVVPGAAAASIAAPANPFASSVPSHSTAYAAFDSFNPYPQTTSGSASLSGSMRNSSLGARANAVPEPYHFLMHEKEVMQQVRQQR